MTEATLVRIAVALERIARHFDDVEREAAERADTWDEVHFGADDPCARRLMHNLDNKGGEG